MKTLILTVGLPRCGKTTWAKEQNIPIVSRDAIRLSLHGKPYLQEAENMITVIEDIMVKSLFLAGHDKVIIDATHTTEKRRERWKNNSWDIVLKTFSTSKNICIQRAINTDRKELIPVIERMAKQIDININQ